MVLLDLSFKLDQKLCTSVIHKTHIQNHASVFSRVVVTHVTVKNENLGISAAARLNLWCPV